MLIRTVVERVNGRVPTFFGAAGRCLKDAVRNAQEIEALGGDYIMLTSPIIGNLSGNDLFNYYKTTCESVKLPFIVQDTGASTYSYTTELMVRLFDEIENIGYVKAEGAGDGWLLRLADLVEKTDGRVTVIGGAAGVNMLQVLRLGVRAFMTGTEAAEIHNAVVSAWLSGDEDLAIDLYYTTLRPYMDMYWTNHRCFLKYMLYKRGIVKNPSQLLPRDAPELTEFQKWEMDWILERIRTNRIKCSRYPA